MKYNMYFPCLQGCDYVIALTHMRTPNDIRLAENVDGIDLILGGHDHVYELLKVGMTSSLSGFWCLYVSHNHPLRDTPMPSRIFTH